MRVGIQTKVGRERCSDVIDKDGNLEDEMPWRVRRAKILVGRRSEKAWCGHYRLKCEESVQLYRFVERCKGM